MIELDPDEELLTVSEVADLLALHYNTVKRLIDRGGLPSFRVCARGDRRCRLSDVQAYVDRLNPPTGEPLRSVEPAIPLQRRAP